jgi:hypothetical protein
MLPVSESVVQAFELAQCPDPSNVSMCTDRMQSASNSLHSAYREWRKAEAPSCMQSVDTKYGRFVNDAADTMDQVASAARAYDANRMRMLVPQVQEWPARVRSLTSEFAQAAVSCGTSNS